MGDEFKPRIIGALLECFIEFPLFGDDLNLPRKSRQKDKTVINPKRGNYGEKKTNVYKRVQGISGRALPKRRKTIQ